MSRVALVVVRFGAGITGGAEALAQQVGAHLADRGHEVTVLTTCAEDYVTWANALPAGESRDGALRVLRFPVRGQRDLQRWEAAMQPFLARCWSAEDEERLLREQGPDCPALLDHLRVHGREHDAVIFFTLLYAPAVLGIPLVWDRAVLVPTLHDEIAAHLDMQARAIRLARFVLWGSVEERALAQRIYDAEGLPGAVAGAGVEPPDDLQRLAAEARRRFGLERPYLLYAGRIDPDKGCGEMFDHFLAWSRSGGEADLVLAGRAWMDVPRHPHIEHVGFVERDEVWGLMAGAAATVVPSRNESLSLAALESLAAGTPVLVTAGSPVLVGHARRSGAGLVYRDAATFAAAADGVLHDVDARRRMGDAGRRYVAERFSWERIMALYERVIARVAARAAAA